MTHNIQIDGYNACKLYIVMKSHFTSKSFDVFKTRTHIKYSREQYVQRHDCQIFERLITKFANPKSYALYLAANFMYGFNEMIWDYQQGIANYNLFLSRQKNIGYVVDNDLKVLDNNNISISDGVSVIRSMTRQEITFETVVILQRFSNVSLTKQLYNVKLLAPLLLRIEKAVKFIEVPTQTAQILTQRYSKS